MSKKLSVAIPTYNRLACLKECIKSILNQTFQDFSIFVFDNASNEPIEEELKKLNDTRIHFIGNDKNIGLGGNINRILAYPFESEYVIIFLDDDAMHPKMLELETSFLDAHKEVVFVASDFRTVSDKTIHNFPNFAQDQIKYVIYKNSQEFLRAEMSWLRAAGDSVMYRVKALEGARMRQDTFFHFADIVLLVEISQKGPCAFITAPLMNYRIHAGQYSEAKPKEYEQGVMEMIPFLRENLPDPLGKNDERLLRTYSVNSLLRACAHINSGFFHTLRFLNECRRQNLIRYRDFRYIDMRGMVSVLSILLGSRKIIDAARWLKNSLPS